MFMFYVLEYSAVKEQTPDANNKQLIADVKNNRHIECAIFEPGKYQPRPVG